MAQQNPEASRLRLDLNEPSLEAGRLIVIANRLPVTVSQDSDGEYQFKMSSGGLVSALLGVRDRLKFIWLGWLGKEIPEEDQEKVRSKLLKDMNCIPVFLPDSIADPFYNGAANGLIWPLFHYEQGPGGCLPYNEEQWNAYRKANLFFAEEVVQVYQPGDYVWIHDYHLMLLPKLLRTKLSSDDEDSILATHEDVATPRGDYWHMTASGSDEYGEDQRSSRCSSPPLYWFLHTPFPSSEVFQSLPRHEEILEGILACDYIGFHTQDYARHFLTSCRRLLTGTEITPSTVKYKNHLTVIGTHPIGIEPSVFRNTLKKESCKEKLKEVIESFGSNTKVIIAVDRLDMIKGIPHRLLGYQAMLRMRPMWREQVVLIQVAVPSRTDVPAYQTLTRQVNTLVGEINAEFGTLSYQPVHYLYKSVTPDELAALYNRGDVCLITSLRDGMNLVSFEYVACQSVPCEARNSPGVLILSEFAGAAQCLSGALRCNPWSQSNVADTIHAALSMTREERIIRHKVNDYYVTKYSSSAWALSFIENAKNSTSSTRLLQHPAAESQSHSATISTLPFSNAIREYTAAQSRCILLTFEDCMLRTMSSQSVDYDARTGHTDRANRTEPQYSVPPALLNVLRVLAADPRNTVIIASDLSAQQMRQLFPIPRLFLISEGGCLVSLPSTKEYNVSTTSERSAWLRDVQAIELPQVKSEDFAAHRTTSMVSMDSVHEKEPLTSYLSGDVGLIDQFSQSVGLQSESNISMLLPQQHYKASSPVKGVQLDSHTGTNTEGFRVRVRDYYSAIPVAKFLSPATSGEHSGVEATANPDAATMGGKVPGISLNFDAKLPKTTEETGGFYSVDDGINGAPLRELDTSRGRIWNQYALSDRSYLSNTDASKGRTVISFELLRHQLESAFCEEEHHTTMLLTSVAWQDQIIHDLERFLQQTPEIRFVSSDNKVFLDFSDVDTDIAELQMQAILDFIGPRSYLIPLDVVLATEGAKRGVIFRPRNGTIDKCLVHIFDYVLTQRMKTAEPDATSVHGLFDFLLVLSDQFDSLGVLTSLSSLLLQSVGLEALLESDPHFTEDERAALNVARITRKDAVVYKGGVLFSAPQTWNKPTQIRRYENLKQSNTMEYKIEGTTKVRNLLTHFAHVSQSDIQS